MKRSSDNPKRLSKGMPSAVLLSILIHVGLFLLAGTLVIFTVVRKQEQKFDPPKAVERPKMKLKKPKVRVKKSSRPKSTARIVAKNNREVMPSIELPQMSGIGDGGLGDSIVGGFDGMPIMPELTIFGEGQSIGNDFVGTFYDFKRNRAGGGIPMNDYQFVDAMVRFTRSGWQPSALAQYYRSPTKLYATCFMVPPIFSTIAPSAFNEPDTIGYAWMVHYKGELVHQDGITFRFWGHGDDVLLVRVDGEVVLNACWPDSRRKTESIGGLWQSRAAESRQYYLGNNKAQVGDWITLEPGVPLTMDVLIGEVPGGIFCSMLSVEVEGEDYDVNRQGAPILPMFKTETPSHALLDTIYEHLVPNEVSLTNGPVFRDYTSSVRSEKRNPAAEETPEPEQPDESPLRIWHSKDGKTVEAEYLSRVGENVILRTTKEKQLKLPVKSLAPDELEYVELANPPALDISLSKKTEQQIVQMSPHSNREVPKIMDYVFGATVRQTSVYAYNHELTVEYFALGQQLLDSRKYMLLDRQKSTFTPTEENERSHRFSGPTVSLIEYNYNSMKRGRKYAEYLVTIRDKRGKIIAHNSSAKWLFENLENLQKLPIGAFMDRTCTRVYPTGPKSTTY